jgi:hypothetical protein
MGRVDYSFGSRTVFSEWASISYLLEVILSLEIAVYILTDLEILFCMLTTLNILFNIWSILSY